MPVIILAPFSGGGGGSQYIGLGTGGGMDEKKLFFLFSALDLVNTFPPRRFEPES